MSGYIKPINLAQVQRPLLPLQIILMNQVCSPTSTIQVTHKLIQVRSTKTTTTKTETTNYNWGTYSSYKQGGFCNYLTSGIDTPPASRACPWGYGSSVLGGTTLWNALCLTSHPTANSRKEYFTKSKCTATGLTGGSILKCNCQFTYANNGKEWIYPVSYTCSGTTTAEVPVTTTTYPLKANTTVCGLFAAYNAAQTDTDVRKYIGSSNCKIITTLLVN